MALLHVMQFAKQTVTAVSPSFATLYTVPAGDRIVVRSAVVRNLALTTQQFSLYVDGIVVKTWNLPSGGGSTGSDEWRPWMVCTPGQVIQARAATASGFNIVLSGSLYTI
jgi:hypothetical protein